MGSYTLTRTWTATDLCGNDIQHVQTITVGDNTDPEFVEELPADRTVECDEVADLTAPTLTATDNCGTAAVTFSEVRTDGTCVGSYTLTRTWTATDLCGNDIQHVQTITVGDNTDPEFVEELPADRTVECDEVADLTAPTLTATDNCGTAAVTFSEVRTDGTCVGSYTLTRTWTATDLCGNDIQHVQTITVGDNTDPEFVEELPADRTVECDEVADLTAPTLTATDNCGTAAVTFSEVRTDGTCVGSYTLTRTWTATDLCGNDIQHVQTITVGDNTDPEFVEELPADRTVECDEVADLTAPTLTATDNCGTAAVTFSEVRTDGTCVGSYTLTRTWTATDLCGNDIQHVQTITVGDNTDPEFVEELPADRTVEATRLLT